MGGGGNFFERNVTRTERNRSFSQSAAQTMSRRSLDPAVDPKNRRLVCLAASPLVLCFDTTRSMGALPKATVDKAALVVGQMKALSLLDDPEVSIAGYGDVLSDRAPVQVGDFTNPRNADQWFKKIWLERGGGSNGAESASAAAYFYAYLCDFPNARTPIFLLTGDEGVHPILEADQLSRLFGDRFGRHLTTSSEQVFRDLDIKFRGNVFMLRRSLRGRNSEPQAREQWTGLLGRYRIATLDNSSKPGVPGYVGDKSVGDVMVGIIALAAGRMSLDEYCDSLIKAREEPQTQQRIAMVRRTLEPIAGYCTNRLLPSEQRVSAEEMEYARTTAVSKASTTIVNPTTRIEQPIINPADRSTKLTESPAAAKTQETPQRRQRKDYQL